MPYVRGETLRDRLDRDGALRVDESLRLCGEVAEALDYAHRAGIVHRDIKPENIMLHEGHGMVADFGIASAHPAEGARGLTMTGAVMGTPAYLSPEQMSGDAVDGRSDLYSLACVLFECLSGVPPFTGTAMAMLAQRLIGEPPSIRLHKPEISEALAGVIQRAMATAPSVRYPTGKALLEALHTPDIIPARKERPAIVVLPFTNLSPDPDSEFFTDGLTEEIITDLSSIRAQGYIAHIGYAAQGHGQGCANDRP